MNRRQFIQTAALATTAAVTGVSCGTAQTKGVNWPIGAFNRPWVREKRNDWTFDQALDGIKAAGYTRMGYLTTGKTEAFASGDATAEYLASIKKKVANRGLTPVMAALRTHENISLDAYIKDMRRQIDNASTLGVEWVLTFGVDDPKLYDDYYKVMADAAPYAQERGLKLVIKPHGGDSATADDLLKCIAKVDHPNFKIWYDAGNIIYYTGKDPVEQLKPIVRHVTGFCAKDCAGIEGQIWLEFGKGKVDFPAVFKVLKDGGFNGPVMVECCAKGPTPASVTAGAKKNRELLEQWFAQV